jgi:chemotaxis signal transduction protein
MADRLVFDIDDKLFGFNTNEVDKVVEVEKVFFLPGRSGIISGIISLSGEPVTVVDARRAVGAKPAPRDRTEGDTHRVIVVRDSERLLGYDIGPTEVTFLWDEATGIETPVKTDTAEKAVELINWFAHYDEAVDILEGPNA